MKTRMVWLLFGLAALTISFAESLSCYSCSIDQSGHGLSTCPETMTQSEAAPTCQGDFCLITWSNYGNQGQFISLACLESLNQTFGYNGPKKVDQCLVLNSYQVQYKFYVYNDMCCFTTSETRDSFNGSSIQYDVATCGCDKDYCNGNAKAFKNKPPRNAMNMDPTTAMNAASFTKWRPSEQYVYGFALIVASFIVALPLGLDPEV